MTLLIIGQEASLDNRKVRIESISKVDVSEYIDFHRVNIEVNGVQTSVLVGRKETDLGINVLSGHDILGFFESDQHVLKEVGDMIRNLGSKD